MSDSVFDFLGEELDPGAMSTNATDEWLELQQHSLEPQARSTPRQSSPVNPRGPGMVEPMQNGGEPESEIIDLTTTAGRLQINIIRRALEEATNFDKFCKQRNFKLMLEGTTTMPCPEETISALCNGIKSGSTRTVRREISKIMSYEWFIQPSKETETTFNHENAAMMAGFLNGAQLPLRHIDPSLRNSDFAALIARPAELLTWAAFPRPIQRISPCVTATTIYARLSSKEIKKMNRDMRRNAISLRILN